MWAIKVDGKIYNWTNSKHHDFLQFLPKYFSKILEKPIAPEDIEAFWYDSGYLFEGENDLEIDGANNLLIYETIPEVEEVLDEDGNVVTPFAPSVRQVKKSLVMKKLPAWPYVSTPEIREIQVPEIDEQTGLPLRDHRGNVLYKKKLREIKNQDGSPKMIIKHVENNGLE